MEADINSGPIATRIDHMVLISLAFFLLRPAKVILPEMSHVALDI